MLKVSDSSPYQVWIFLEKGVETENIDPKLIGGENNTNKLRKKRSNFPGNATI
jgi:hypothetical protein